MLPRSHTGIGFIIFVMHFLDPSSASNAAVFDGSGIAVIEAPAGGVRLGQGIDLSSGLPTFSKCVTGQIQRGPGNRPQAVTLKMRDNLDASSFFHEIAASAAAQASWITGNASAETEYVARHKFVSELATISVVETVEQKETMVPGTSYDIRLTPSASNSLQRSPSTFRKACGDGFAYVLISGAELIATISKTNTTYADAQATDTTASVNLFGSGASGRVATTLDSLVSSASTTIDYLSSGGSGAPVPTDKAHLLSAIQGLASEAARNPTLFRIVVRSYQSLPDWPASVVPFRAPSALESLMTKFWRVDALYQQSAEARAHPDDFIFGWGVSKASLSETEQEITALRNRLANDVLSCTTTPHCAVSPISMKQLYKLAIHLPLRRDFTPTGRKLEQWREWVNNMVPNFNQHSKGAAYRLIWAEHSELLHRKSRAY
jgi:hypothetical protein